MAIVSSKSVKETKMEAPIRGWTARPILGAEFTDDPPLQEVFVARLKQKKDTSKAIQSISVLLPGFHHLKRCSAGRLLLAPLDLKSEAQKDDVQSPDKLKILLKEGGFDLSLLEDDFELLNVPSRVPRTKAQAARASKIWPVNFHPDPNVETLIDGSIFDERQLQLIENYMSLALAAARLEAIGNEDCNGGAAIVDPEDGRILALAASRIDRHPMWHAAMLAVDLVAKLQGGGAWNLIDDIHEDTQSANNDDPKKKERNIKRKYHEEAPLRYPKNLSDIPLPVQESLKSTNVRRGRRNNTKVSDPENLETSVEKCGPYLCTSYWVFLTKEPCPLCAMALLHSRVSRIFYGTSNDRAGVLGSKGILHALPGLNHRYQVWSGILERECKEVSEKIERRNVD